MRGAALLFGLAVGVGCTASPEPPHSLPGGPAVEVIQREGEPLHLFWEPPRALRVQIRQPDTGGVVWRAEAGPTRSGPRASLLNAPLAVQARGVPPGSDPPGGFPPDGGGAWATEPALESGVRYVVTVTPCVLTGQDTPQIQCEPVEELSFAFVTR